MFKKIGLVSLVLVSCQNSSPKTVKFEEFFQKAELPMETGCEWKEADLSVFNQPKQRIKFRYKVCNKDPSYNVWTSDGNWVEFAYADMIYDSFAVLKPSSMRQAQFIESLIETKYSGSCKAVKHQKNVWKIQDDLSQEADNATLPCGRYGRNAMGQTYTFFKDGIAISASPKSNDIDLASITYEQDE